MFEKLGQHYICYIQKDGINLYVADGDQSFQFDYVKEQVLDLEVKDKAALEAHIVAWLEKIKVRPGSVYYVLASSVLFEKDLGTADIPDQVAKVQQFLDTVPLSPEKVSKVLVTSQTGTVIYVTNAQLFQSIVAAFESVKFQSAVVVPALVFGTIGTIGTLSKIEIETIRKTIGRVKDADFLTSGVMQPTITEIKQVAPGKDHASMKKTIILIIILLLLGGLVAGLVVTKKLPLPSFLSGRNTTEVTNTTTNTSTEAIPLEIASESAVPAAETKAKDAITIKVLNGSGKVGQAGTIKTALLAKGFVTIETGNTKTSSGSTTLAVTENVGDTEKDDMRAVLNDLFSTVTEEVLPTDSTSDVVITTAP